MLSLNLSRRAWVLAVLAGMVLLLWLTAPEKASELQESRLPVVPVISVTRHDLSPVETVSGRLLPARKAELHFELAGQVESRPVEPGQVVEAGALLLSLAPGDFEDALAEAGAQLTREKADIERDRKLLALSRQNYRLQKKDLDRLEKLGEDSLVSKSLLDETRIKLLQLEGEVARLRASTATAESRLALREAERNRAARNLERTRLVAPFAGTVNAVAVQTGDYVTPSQGVVGLFDAASLDLYVEVRGDVAQALEQGQAVDVLVNGESFPARINALQIDPDPQTFTHAVSIRMDGSHARPGQVAQARLPLSSLQQVVAVPSTAVLFDEGVAYVFRVVQETLSRVPVVAGPRVDGLQVILSGIAAGDTVVTGNVAALSNGQAVRSSAAAAPGS